MGFAERTLRAAYLGGARRDCLEREKSHRGSGGFTLLEVLVGATILAVALLAMSAMFPVGYTNITEAGKMTMAITGARQVFEEVSALPFDNIINLDGFDTLDPATLPLLEPERTIARRWRYALAGEGDGFTFTATEKGEWSTLSTGGGNTLNGSGLINVVTLSATLDQITVTITYPGRSPSVQLVTNVTRL
ncbi:MAG: prepilin-type N-terminal cleavage/methylation domain-containing protein [candidate division NC10 bacterium]|jgi:prepilin-type N-terminal cleavage/methylation domain-containing protein|nr:prepilin-type N-terminal cleavage/methylation domain-containing protein [candidate division NC10 bacterium]